jgi:hypothetical protein
MRRNLELENYRRICLKAEENQESLRQNGRSRGPPETYGILARVRQVKTLLVA